MKTVKGNLITLAEREEFDIIVQGCNCFHTMGSGLAGQLVSKYPRVLEADKKQSKYGDKEKLGDWSVAVIPGKFIVINAYTQYFFGMGQDVFEYGAFEKFLTDFQDMIEYLDESNNFDWLSGHRIREFKRTLIGFPMIGAGLAGGDWSRISKMIEEFSEKVKDFAEVTVVEYQP